MNYNDLDAAIAECIALSKVNQLQNGLKEVHMEKTDMTSAFRVLPLKVKCFRWLILKAEDPRDGKTKYFVEKCLPFGASISCSHYQRFSDSLKHILQYRTGHRSIVNYLDDFLFLVIMKIICDFMINQFLLLCNELHIPVAEEKTEWGTTLIVFLGILLDGRRLLISIPLEKQQKALKLLDDLTGKKKVTVKQLQVLTGYLNFLSKAIVPGHTFIRRLYSKYTSFSSKLKQHHHVSINSEMRFNCEVWRHFLYHHQEKAVCCPMIDL